MTAVTTDIDDAIDALAAARATLAEHHAAKRRLAERLRGITTEVLAAERASIAAASTAAPDEDQEAIRSLSDARERLGITQRATQEKDEAILAAERDVDARTTALATARAKDALQLAVERVADFQKGLEMLVDSVTAIETHIETAKQHAASVGLPLNVSHVIGRRIAHVLQGQKISITDAGGTVASRNPGGAASAVRDALENPRWSNF
jgi:hypothetical protein